MLPKKTDPTLGDLRPISMLPVFSKIIEKILWRQLYKYVTDNSILPLTQSGFRTGYSCTTALLNIVDDILRATDTGKLTILCLIDFSKAFDKINHCLLSAILHNIGLSQVSNNLIMNYVSNRRQAVKVRNDTSDFLTLTSGSPQGSILSPLIFTIYTSTLTDSLRHCVSHTYADDTQIYISCDESQLEDACRRMSSDLQALADVSRQHGVEINSSKTELIVFHPRKVTAEVRQRVNVGLDGVRLQVKEKVRNLGVILDQNLKFQDHINSCLKKTYLSLKYIYSIRQFITMKTKIMLRESLILSHFNYADVVYSPFLAYHLQMRVQRVQNSCIRLIFGLRRRDHVSNNLKSIGWLNMTNRRIIHTALTFYKIINTGKPPYLMRKVVTRSDVHTINVRFRGALSPPCHRTEWFKRSFSYQIYHIHNKFIFTNPQCTSVSKR